MSTDEHQKLVSEAAEALLTPLARLCVAQGLPFAQAEELFKRAFVRAAREARRETGTAATRDVSQVSITTGINRREVARITAELQPLAAQRTSPASQVLLRWAANRKLRGRDGKPRALPRSGPAPSFEALAQTVTRHVHPRSLLDELCRLGLAQLSDDGQTVSLLADVLCRARTMSGCSAFWAPTWATTCRRPPPTWCTATAVTSSSRCSPTRCRPSRPLNCATWRRSCGAK